MSDVHKKLTQRGVKAFETAEKAAEAFIKASNDLREIGLEAVNAGMVKDANAAIRESYELQAMAGDLASKMVRFYEIHGIWSGVAIDNGQGRELSANYAVTPLDGGR